MRGSRGGKQRVRSISEGEGERGKNGASLLAANQATKPANRAAKQQSNSNTVARLSDFACGAALFVFWRLRLLAAVVFGFFLARLRSVGKTAHLTSSKIPKLMGACAPSDCSQEPGAKESGVRWQVFRVLPVSAPRQNLKNMRRGARWMHDDVGPLLSFPCLSPREQPPVGSFLLGFLPASLCCFSSSFLGLSLWKAARHDAARGAWGSIGRSK